MFVQRKRKKGIRFNFCLKTPELMIFERKEKSCRLRETNETRDERREQLQKRRERTKERQKKSKSAKNTRERKNEKKEKKEKKCVTNAPTKRVHHTPQLKKRSETR